MSANAVDIDNEPATRVCSNCFDPITQVRMGLDGIEDDDFCSAACADAWALWWKDARSVMEAKDGE